jgi:2',3'-cyclic-nucleotide 2'-phosphodiesterase/3'-nucleotidase
VLVTQAGTTAERLGRADLVLERPSAGDRWKVASRRASTIAVTDSVPVNHALAAFAEPFHQATQRELSRPIAEATREIGAPRGRFDDGPLWELIHEAQLAASGADVSLAALPDPPAPIRAGVVTVRDVLRACPLDQTLTVVEMSVAELEQALEHSARYLSDYTWAADRPLADPARPGDRFDSAEGVGYEIDLTRPAGDRIGALTLRGAPLPPERRLKVVVRTDRLNAAGGFEPLQRAPRTWKSSRPLRDIVIDHTERRQILSGAFKRNWTLLPDYAATIERPLIDRLVRGGAMAPADLERIRPDERAIRGDLAWWLAHAFGWREKKLSGAFVDAPDSLEPWLDGLLKRKILGVGAEGDHFYPMKAVGPILCMDWCERAARHQGYHVARGYDADFRRGLVAGLGGAAGKLETIVQTDSLTCSQLVGMIANLRFPTLRILETTDFHGAILGGARERRTQRPVGGSAVLAAHIERLRAENPAGTVLIDGGDCFQGTMISNLQFGRPVVEQMNALGYSALAVGNHEFDWTADTLERRVREMRFAALSANTIERKNQKPPAWVRPDTVVTRRGIRLGILGLSYRLTPTVTLARHVRHLEFRDDSAVVARLVPGLRKRADHVIVVGHVPAVSDSARRAVDGDLVRLARGVSGVDAWFGGHSHNQVHDRVNGVPVMIAGSHGEVIAVCDLVIDPVAKKVLETRTRLVPTYADEVTPDSLMRARVERWNEGVAPIAAREVGRNARTLLRNRGGESPLGNLVTDAMRGAVQAEVALQNSGGLRADFPEGVVTRGRIYEVMPFDNQIFTLGLNGAEIELALEQALAGGRVTQVSGIRYAFDLSRPELDRVVSLADSAGRPLDPARVYRVACNDFMATGGDNYRVLSGGRDRDATGILVRDAIEAYVVDRTRRLGAVDVQTDGRIRRVSERRGDGE